MITHHKNELHLFKIIMQESYIGYDIIKHPISRDKTLNVFLNYKVFFLGEFPIAIYYVINYETLIIVLKCGDESVFKIMIFCFMFEYQITPSTLWH